MEPRARGAVRVVLVAIGLQGRLILRWLQILNLGTAGSAVVERGPNGRMRVKG